jgi:Ni2+-binding GTPase involved in maturation of urease and hydrogenase
LRDTRPTLVLAGGFLGAGKTTLLLRAAHLLEARGMRAAIITNDQGGALVDSRMAAAVGVHAAEVAGACFCCRFHDLIEAAQGLLELKPDVIFAEPVGSCIDLSATVLQPLKQSYAGQFRLAPLSVLVDARRAAEMLRPDADPRLGYLFRNQIAEADLVVFTKADLCAEAPELPGAVTRFVSARTGEGVTEWLDEVLSGRLRAGGCVLDVDYERYAAAEAALGWLNWEAEVRLRTGMTPAEVAGPFLEDLDAELTRAAAPVAHLKVFCRAATGYIRAGVCKNGEEPAVQGDLLASPARRHELIVNLRACALPVALEQALARAVEKLPGKVRVLHSQAFQPARPVPERRVQEVV